MKRKKKILTPKGENPKKQIPFNNPFESLKDLQKELQEQEKKTAKSKPQEAEEKPAPEKVKAKGLNEEELFEFAMGGVEPLEERENKVLRDKKNDYVPGSRAAMIEAEALKELDDIVSGKGEFDISPSDEYIEIRNIELDLQTLKKLKQGDFARQAWLDLHGKTRDEARAEVERFLHTSQVRGLRCVGIIPGRGLNSQGGVAVLKPRLAAWLKRGRFKKMVLAVVSALPKDGGLGAVYVLLRKL